MAQTIFSRNGLTVTSKTDILNGSRVEFFVAQSANLDFPGVDQLVKVLTDWSGDMKRLGICAECNAKSPWHIDGCRQATDDQVGRFFTLKRDRG